MTEKIQSVEESVAKESTQDVFMKNMQLMNQIVSSMKEIPQLPSEAPKDVHYLTKVEFPVTGGILTWMEGYDQPYRGFPYYEFVDKIDLIKKISRAVLSGVYHALKKKRLSLLTLIPAFWVSRIAVHISVNVFYRIIERFKIRRICYSQSVRELHRVFSLVRDKETNKERELRNQLRDLICMVVENDNAYRYRLQDVIVEIDKKKLKKSPISEIIRLFDILLSRETTQDIKNTWILVKYFIRFYLSYDRKLKNILTHVLENINIEEMSLSVEDQYFCIPRKDYRFGFMDNNITLCQQKNFTSKQDIPQATEQVSSVG